MFGSVLLVVVLTNLGLWWLGCICDPGFWVVQVCVASRWMRSVRYSVMVMS